MKLIDLNEGLIDWISRKLGMSWGQVGDKVRGSVVAEYLSHQTWFKEETLNRIRKSSFQLINIDLDTAKRFRGLTDAEASSEVIDPDKQQRMRRRKLTHDSLVKNPPVVDQDGFIWDGNHRIDRAIKIGLEQIPVLIQIKGDRWS